MTYAFLAGCCAHCHQYQYAVGKPSDAPLEKCWVFRPQLCSSCHLRPRGGRQPKWANYTCGADNIQVQLVLYSTFEPVDLPGESAGMALWKPWACRSCTSPHPRPFSIWASR